MNEIDEILDNFNKHMKEILKDYDIRKKPKLHCFKCIHYHTIGPGETFSPNPCIIEECRKGHKIKYAADDCPDFYLL